MLLDCSQAQKAPGKDNLKNDNYVSLLFCVLFVCVCIFFFILTSLLYLEVPQAVSPRLPAPSVHPPRETALLSKTCTSPLRLQSPISQGMKLTLLFLEASARLLA